MVGCNDINLVYRDWFSNFQSIVEQHIRRETVVIRPHDKPLMNGKVRGAIRKRNRLLKIHSRLKSPASWEKYRIQRNYTSSLIRHSKKIYYENLNSKLSDPTICSKKWWGIIQSLYGQKIQGTIPPLVEGSRTIFDAKEKAELFNEYFASQSTLDDSMAELPFEIEYFQSSRILLHVTTTEREIRDLFSYLYISKACGPDIAIK